MSSIIRRASTSRLAEETSAAVYVTFLSVKIACAFDSGRTRFGIRTVTLIRSPSLLHSKFGGACCAAGFAAAAEPFFRIPLGFAGSSATADFVAGSTA